MSLADLAGVEVTSWQERAAKALDAQAYHDDPVAFLQRFIDWRGNELTRYQKEIITAVPVRRKVAVRGPHGLGKSAVAALAVIWFAVTRELALTDWKVLTTASAWRHLTIYLWPEIHKWIRRVRWEELGMEYPKQRTQLLDLRLKLNHGAASALASDDPVNLEGAHADSILYVFDEAKAIIPATWDAAEGALAAGGASGEEEEGRGRDEARGRGDGSPLEAFALAISTPGPPQGRFYDIHARKPGYEDWWVRHVKLYEAVKAGRISKDWAEQRKRQWGEQSALYKNRVLGEFHAADEDAAIPLQWAELAVERWHAWDDEGRQPRPGRTYLGVDVARSGGDETAIARRRGDVVENVQRHSYADTMQTTAKVMGMLGNGERAVVDAIGIGAGVYDRLKELDYQVTAYVGSGKTSLRTRTGEHGFRNTRSAAWWHVRELLDPAFDPTLCLPDDDQLLADLCAPRWEERTGVPPVIQIEPKEELNKRIGRSTDTGDAVVMSLWAERLRGQVEIAEPRFPGQENREGQRPRIRNEAPRTSRLKVFTGRVLSPLQGNQRSYRGR